MWGLRYWDTETQSWVCYAVVFETVFEAALQRAKLCDNACEGWIVQYIDDERTYSSNEDD
jgi:hypothetical protein